MIYAALNKGKGKVR